MKLPAFPEPLRALLTRLPHYPGSAAFAVLITIWLGKYLNTEALPELVDKRIKLQVSDMGITLAFRATPDGFVPCGLDSADLTIAATAQDFYSLALRREDPDTLFFARRLTMEGDTELGLLVKNTLDALDTAALRIRLPHPAIVFRLFGLSLRDL